MITINQYTGNWQAALRPTPPEVGDTVELNDSADAREWSDFKAVLVEAGLDLAWDCAGDEDGFDEYFVEEGTGGEIR